MSIEMMTPLANVLSEYGDVTVPDLPGFGGMTNFYSIGKTPNLDTYADYLSAFIKLRYKKNRLTLFGVGFGYSLLVHTLQKHPDLCSKVDIVGGINGLLHHEDIRQTNLSRNFNLVRRSFQGLPLLRSIAKATTFQPQAIKTQLQINKIDLDDDFLQSVVNSWQSVHVKTLRQLQKAELRLDLCQQNLKTKSYNLELPSIYRDIDTGKAEAHAEIVFSSANYTKSRIEKDLLCVLGDQKLLNAQLPKKLIQELKS